ncbi:alpha/beta hydrolase family protein [Phytoactinopolyspora limicola]|uniref:alpha/beta hydrolase family protein n=1 Tax=Phytoactinopolyspora limicola TaxID=2715536 RepID=UPI00140E5708|nr:prolyl oligopeptidase family serine peptidase [Phytoactinopolyspora limicola]
MSTWGFGPHLDGLFDVGGQLTEHVRRRSAAALAAGHAENDGLGTVADVRRRQAEIRAAMLEGCGGLPDRDDGAPPAVEHVGEVAGDGYVVERLIIETLPDVYVPANLYLPQRLAGVTGGVLWNCGHSPIGKAAERYQDACARLARNGLVAMVIDPIGQGERWSYLSEDGSPRVPCNMPEHSYAGVQCWWGGESIARYFIHDARSAIDYLAARPEVDASRIAAAGNSGGGTLTTWLMAVEPRLTAAVVSSFVSDRASILRSGKAQDAEQHLPAGAVAGIDHEDLLMSMAPRPVLVCSANYDFFPIEGTVSTVSRARRAFEIFDAMHQLEHVRVDERHGFTPGLAEAATEFFVRHLGNDPDAPVDHRNTVALPEDELRCTTSGQVVLDRPHARRVFDLNLDRYPQVSARRGDPASVENDVDAQREWLSERVNGGRDLPVEFFPRWLPARRVDEGVSAPVVIRRACWASERDLFGAGVLVTPADVEFSSLQVVLFNRGTADVDEKQAWLAEQAAAGVASFVVDVRGVGSLAPNPVNARPLEGDYGTLFLLLTELIWLDDSLAAGQAFDVLRAVRFVRTDSQIDLKDRPVSVYGEGAGAFTSALAAVLEPTLAEVTVRGPVVDPFEMVTNRYYGDDRTWLSLVPGLTTAVSRRLFAGLLPDGGTS